ncbi:hypothetical protein [Prauserella muralis]|uniref:Uncharacterized protein n=1 Tax=Prauserella muralis TaxID=588067 RepID=A0A2V4AKP6_9PSEU|nr:hypothetical protein [Prauserella muralis]PXY20881.1 hypothetical protein BAY60_25595 [Prauserella muralis]TWE29922.1 hypothetical protein FHX69_2615 [Prauserella muralis]
MRVEVTTQGVAKLAADLEDVPDEKGPELRRVVARGALNVKEELRDNARSSGTYKHFHRSISYDMVGDLEAEIGPDKGRVQGALGNLLYFGRRDTAPVLNLTAPLHNEAPRFEQALADAAGDVL